MQYACACRCDLANRVGTFSNDVRRRHDQTAFRPMLARSNLSVLSLRNSAAAQSTKLVSSSFAAVGSQGRCHVHSLCSTCGAVVLFRACATVLFRRWTNDRVSTYSDFERESFVAELHHDRAVHPVFRRPFARANHSPSPYSPG